MGTPNETTLDDLFDTPLAADRSDGFEEPQDLPNLPELPRRELVDPRLMASINDLLKGGVIEKVCNDDQLQNAVAMRDQLRKHRLDLQDEKARINADPEFARFRESISLIIDKTKQLEAMEKNLGTEASRYQMAKQAEADRLRREAEEKAAAEKRRLAEEEHKRLMAEEAKRREAEPAAKAAEQEADAAKRAALIEQANAANAAADAELKAAADAAIAVNAVPVERIPDAAPIRGLKPRMVYTAQVHDYFAAAIALLQGEDRGLLMTAAFQKAIQQAANKKAAYMGDRFELPGCSKVETPASR